MSEVVSLQRQMKALRKILCQKIKEEKCEHVFEKEIPSGPRDNGEYYYVCVKCKYQK